MNPNVLTEVVGDTAECAGKCQNAEIALRRLRKASKDLAHIHKLVERVDDNNAGMFDQCPHHRMIAGKRAGVRASCLLGFDAAAGMHHHDGLAASQRFARDVDEFLRTPNILCVESDDLRHRIVEQILDKIGKAETRLVAGRNPA